jgi:hypothetical protein
MNQALAQPEYFPDIIADMLANADCKTPAYWRGKIMELESCLMQFEQLPFEPKHWFSKGLYARELFLPKGMLIIGKIHKTSHLNIISCGDVTVVTEDGIERFVAPHTMISKVGVKRVVFANEDSIWTTLHPTDETDLEKIEADIICKDYTELDLLNAPEHGVLEGITS